LSDKFKELVYLVDDDESVRQGFSMLFLSAGIENECFSCAEDFLAITPREKSSCLVTDIKMSGLSGLDLQKELVARGLDIPIIFVTAFDTAESRQEAKRVGASGYFRKPVDDSALLDSIHWALSNKEK
jgi:FixJ family two-component response regulator